MVETVIKAAMKKSNAEKFLPVMAGPEKIIDEISEHFGVVKWSLKRILLPLAIFYVVIGFILQEHVLGELFTAFLIFLYASFLPDLDSFFLPNSKNSKKAGRLEKRIALFFAPLVIYYTLSQKSKLLDMGSEKPFHNKRAMFEFAVFLFVFGLMLYFSPFKAFFFALFGFLGFLTHLIVDKQLNM